MFVFMLRALKRPMLKKIIKDFYQESGISIYSKISEKDSASL